MKLLDLFCGAGGAGEGYRLAGFEVTGVDIKPQPRYKPGRFIQGDALEYAAAHGHEYDVIHASPPCQAYSVTKTLHKAIHPDLLAPTRDLLIRIGRPYVIENVPGAPMTNALYLCGTMFPELRVIRHRLFETWPVVWIPPNPCDHWGSTGGGANGKLSSFAKAEFICVVGNRYIKADGAVAMGIDWMTMNELDQAIPPAYTEWIGRQLLKAMQL